MAIGNVELMHECFPKHLRMGKPSMSMERCKAGIKKAKTA